MIIRMHEDDIIRDELNLTPGTYYIPVEKIDTISGNRWHELHRNMTGGIPGNMDNKARRYHGWRGTTNDISTYALGLRQIKSSTHYKNGTVKIVLTDDLAPEEP